MTIEYRPNDPIREDDDVILRGGSGAVDILVTRALDNAPDYEEMRLAGVVRSCYTISVHVPRGTLATPQDIKEHAFYRRYGAVIEADAGNLGFDFVQIVATTPVSPDGEPPSDLDLCHYDIVVEAADEDQLRERIALIRDRFTLWRRPKP